MLVLEASGGYTKGLAHPHERLKVVVVVEDLLGLLADVQNGFHGGNRVFAPEGLGPKHDAVHPIQHSVGHICCLCPTRCPSTVDNNNDNDNNNNTVIIDKLVVMVIITGELQVCRPVLGTH